MKITRSHEQWRTILTEQQASGLTIIDYCREHQLATSSFYVFRKKLGITSNSFVRTQVTQQVEVITPQPLIELTLGKATLRLPSSTSATYLGQVLRALV
ncbi:IS66 family insertion sequence hypothetical protein [Colwellia sp. 75C3]|uniref:IS66 family insertion sequence element accessory protein TnpA n=1 Tax=Colwellia sp. 75C3 TaxID=888425 RepID=UPI000C32D03C|nr:hypothetical protein [Colwellia sp. 75C3]PKG86982.1 IS66 family insertion sequence hypothetical protein [Colwellia sp. 75C3]